MNGVAAFTVRMRATVACALIGLINHFVRDFIGALEIALQQPVAAGGLGLSSAEYASLQSLYFGPNLVVPLASGMIAQRYGARRAMLGFACVASCGSAALLAGFEHRGQASVLFWLRTGRLLTGIAYEALDGVWVPMLAPLYSRGAYVLLSSVINAMQRAGSVLAFAATPLLCETPTADGASITGLVRAAAPPCILGALMLLPALLAQDSAELLTCCSRALPAHAASHLATASGADEPLANSPLTRATSADERLAPAPGAAARCAAHVATLHARLDRRWWLFVGGATCVYTAMVPFWFFGSSYLVATYPSLTAAAADRLLLLPEGAILLGSPPIGLLLARARLSRRSTAALIAALLLIVVLAYAAMAATPQAVPPGLALGVIGVAWCATHTALWGQLPEYAPPDILALCTGLVGSALNAGPTLVPLWVAAWRGATGVPAGAPSSALIVWTLAVFAAAGAALFGSLACMPAPNAAAGLPSVAAAKEECAEVPSVAARPGGKRSGRGVAFVRLSPDSTAEAGGEAPAPLERATSASGTNLR